jgi:hypothetical protein
MNLPLERAWLLFPALVTALALTMLIVHRRAWRALQSRSLDACEFDYHHRRFRRRVQASSLLALVGPALVVGHRIPPREWPWLFVGYWILVVLVTAWIGLLALGDAVASGRYFSLLRRQRTATRAELQDEISRVRAPMAVEGNDMPPGD